MDWVGLEGGEPSRSYDVVPAIADEIDLSEDHKTHQAGRVHQRSLGRWRLSEHRDLLASVDDCPGAIRLMQCFGYLDSTPNQQLPWLIGLRTSHRGVLPPRPFPSQLARIILTNCTNCTNVYSTVLLIEIQDELITPIYRQVVNQVRGQIASGSLKPGDKLPSVRELARFLDINFNTVQKAYRELKSLGTGDHSAGSRRHRLSEGARGFWVLKETKNF